MGSRAPRASARGRRHLWLVAACAAALLAVPAQAGASLGATRAVLDRAEALLSGGRGGPARDATAVLRDLALGVGSLRGAERRRAGRLLARPFGADQVDFGAPVASGEGRLCDEHLCVHWVENGADAPPGSDGNPRTVPAWARTTFGVLRHVWATEVEAMGYRAPLSDASAAQDGGDGRLDVYLADVGTSVYGYCTSDDPRASRQTAAGSPALSAFCVLDDDFARSQFPGVHGLPALEVTAAHELFHAVQFAYDAWEDTWLMEGTATWIEDEVYDSADDNRRFLGASPLTEPGAPLDLNLAPNHYGAWIWWRYLSESLGRDVVRSTWARAAGADVPSLRATVAALAARGIPFATAFAGFAAANRFPGTSYEEGRAYSAAGASGSWRLGRVRRSTGWSTFRLDHLTSGAAVFRPGRRAAARARLRIALDLPSLRRGSAARLVVVLRNGRRAIRPIALGRAGRATLSVPFSFGHVARVVLVLVNASTRLEDCGRWATPFSCSGVPTDDRRAFRFRARVASQSV